MKSPIKLLFIGNSYVFFNSLPQAVEIVANTGKDLNCIEAEMVVEGGVTLHWHLLNGDALAAIKSKKWDYVILQDHSQLGSQIVNGKQKISDPSQFYNSVRLFNYEIKAAGAKTALMLTWAPKSRPEEQKILNSAYYQIAKELDIDLIPVGIVWQEVKSMLPSTCDLYTEDGHHPSPLGTLTTAFTIYSYFFSEAPDELPEAVNEYLSSEAVEGAKCITSTVKHLNEKPSLITDIQKTASRVIRNFDQSSQSMLSAERSFKPPEVVPGNKITLNDLKGRWLGTLELYQNPTVFRLNIEQKDHNWVLNITIQDEKQDRSLVCNEPINEENIIDNKLCFYIELSNDIYVGSYKDGFLIGIVNSAHAVFPQPGRIGSWKLARETNE